MKNLLITALLLFSLFGYAQDKEIKTESKIEAVTVYFNQAEISRVAKTKIPGGKHVLRFTGLTQYLDPASLQVSGKGHFTILSVRHQINFLEEQPADARLEELRKKVKEIQDKVADNNAMLSVFSSEEALLNENRKIGGSETGVDVSGLKEAAAFYRSRMLEIKKKQLELKRANEKLNKDYQKYQGQLNALLNPKQEPSSEVLVSIEAEEAVPEAEFVLQYVVDHAAWFPSYDIRGKGLDKPLDLEWKANVSQQTGVDWEDAAISFSTGNPSLGGVKPELDKWYLDLRNGYPYSNHSGSARSNNGKVEGYVLDASSGEAVPYVTVRVAESSIGTVTDLQGHFELIVPRNARYLEFFFVGYEKKSIPIQNTLMTVYLQPQATRLEEVVVEDHPQLLMERKVGGMAPGMWAGKAEAEPMAAAPQVQQKSKSMSRTFVVSERYTIRSEGPPSTLRIAHTSLDAHFLYYAVPKIENDAFLAAEITGWDSLNLLAGEANLYFEGAFVGKTVIDPASTGDTLSLSLGRDPSVVISREKIRDFNKKRFLGNKKIQSTGWEITVRNKKDKPVRIVIQDQIPVSHSSEIVVTAEELSGAKLDAKNGHLEWVLDIPPGSSKSVRFSYSVKYPKGGNILLE